MRETDLLKSTSISASASRIFLTVMASVFFSRKRCALNSSSSQPSFPLASISIIDCVYSQTFSHSAGLLPKLMAGALSAQYALRNHWAWPM